MASRIAHIRLYLIVLVILALGLPGIVVTLTQIYTQQEYVSRLSSANNALRQEISTLQASKHNWDDPNYVLTQGRKRFYLVKPGETGFLLINDLPQQKDEEQHVANRDIVLTSVNWARAFLESVINVAANTSHSGDAVSPETKPSSVGQLDKADKAVSANNIAPADNTSPVNKLSTTNKSATIDNSAPVNRTAPTQ